MTKGMVFVICFFAAIAVFGAAPIMYFKKGWFCKWFHDALGWHQPDNSPQWSDGCSLHAKCKWCGMEIMQDSQGNWF